MSWSRPLVVVSFAAVLAGCGGAGSAPPAPGAEPARSAAVPGAAGTTGQARSAAALTADHARAAIESCPQFAEPTREIKILEGQVATGVERGLWTFSKRKNREGKIVVDMQLTPEGRKYFSAAAYYWGGVVPLTLAQPIGREVVEITAIEEKGSVDFVRTVRFKWRYADAPEAVRLFAVDLQGRVFQGSAVLQRSGNEWSVMGPVRGLATF